MRVVGTISHPRLFVHRRGSCSTAVADNRTRFIIVARSSADVVPGPAAAPDDNHYALLRISAGNTPLDAVLKALELNITQVVQWPPEAGTSGAKVHFVKVRQGRDMSVDRTQSVARWHRELQNAVQYRVHKVGGEGVVLGVW